MFFAAQRADGPTDVTVSCLVRLSRFGPEKRCPQKKKKKKKNRLPSIFLNINSHERMIPDDLGDPELPELKQEMTRWAKLYLDILCPRENDLFVF